MKATVVISSKNRCADLINAIESSLSQTAVSEIIIMDDGSSDETPQYIPRRFTDVKYIRFECSRGYIQRRNEAATLAEGEILISIDDDAEFSSPHVVAQALADFENPRIGALAIPLREPNRHGQVLNQTPDDCGVWITDAFVGTSYAVRKSYFCALGGFRAALVHQGEESDFCIRLLDHGAFVRMARADPVIHHESPVRDSSRMNYYGRRNDVLFAVNNAPAEAVALHMIGTTLNGMRTAIGGRNRGDMYRGLVDGWREGIASFSTREPVSTAAYATFRELRKRGPRRLSEVAHRIPLAKIFER